jgi:hypothetical protein
MYNQKIVEELTEKRAMLFEAMRREIQENDERDRMNHLKDKQVTDGEWLLTTNSEAEKPIRQAKAWNELMEFDRNLSVKEGANYKLLMGGRDYNHHFVTLEEAIVYTNIHHVNYASNRKRWVVEGNTLVLELTENNVERKLTIVPINYT